MNQQAFEAAKEKVIGANHQRLGIGTLSEKTVHAILKNYYQPNEDCQEIPIEKYVADIYTDGEIIEVQTRQFNKMRNKLNAFLPLYPVTIVYPIPREKWVIWIDEETGTLSKPRKSPQKGTVYTVFPELYKIKNFLKDPNLRLKLVLMDMNEYKLLNGWSKDKKKGASRYDRLPTELVSEVEIHCPKDYMLFVPPELEGPFTVKEFAKAARIPVSLAGTAVNILCYMETIVKVGNRGKAYVYQVIESYSEKGIFADSR